MLKKYSSMLETASEDVQGQMDLLEKIDALNRTRNMISRKLGRV